MRRLTQDVTALEIQPTIEDVFHADTSSVEDYLKQVEEATILAAIQVQPTQHGHLEGMDLPYLITCVIYKKAAVIEINFE